MESASWLQATALGRLPPYRQVVATALRLCEGAYGVAFIFQDRGPNSFGGSKALSKPCALTGA